MSSYSSAHNVPSFRTVLHTCAQSPDLPFRDVLPAEQIETLAREEGVAFREGPGCVYSVAVSLWAFLAQTLSKDKSCTAAVARVFVLLVAVGREACAAGTGAYCKARAKLPERFLQRLVFDVGQRLEDEAPSSWRWKERRAILVDGTTVLLADTPANQAVYPQMRSQKAGVGFPILRLVVLFGLATAAVLGAAMGPYAGKETGETALLRPGATARRRCPGRRPLLLLVLDGGLGCGAGRGCGLSPPSVAALRLPAGSPAGVGGSRRDLEQAAAAGVDGRGDLRQPAGYVDDPGAPGHGRQAWLSGPGTDSGDDAGGSRSVP